MTHALSPGHGLPLPWTERLFYPASPPSVLARVLLSPLTVASWGYGAGVRLRNALFDVGGLAQQRVEGLRVISVGNVTVGGAGKTPVVCDLAERLLRAGLRVAILSRGYGRVDSRVRLVCPGEPLPSAADIGDEPLLLARRLPEAFILVGADRVALARRAREECGAQVALLDDGMQHRRLARDVDIAVVDEAAGLGNGALLPRGPLREPSEAFSRASLVWLRVGPAPAAPLPAFQAPVVRAAYVPREIADLAGGVLPLSVLEREKILPLAAIARPGRFLQTLESVGAEVSIAEFFPDHHRFRPAELVRVADRARALGARIVTTEKDAVRLPAGFPAWVLRMDVQVLAGEEHLARALGLAA